MITRLLCTGLPTSGADDAKNIDGWATSFQKGGGRFATDTMAPFDGCAPFDAVAAREKSGQEINAWIPMKQDAESVMDFDAGLRDPEKPHILRAGSQADWRRPNDAGSQAMPRAVTGVAMRMSG